MVLAHEHPTLESASVELLTFALEGRHWLSSEPASRAPSHRPALLPVEYQAQVGKLRICASVRVHRNLDVVLCVAFRGPGLTPARAAAHLEAFLKERVPLQPNTEWQVEVDERQWIHFQRRYVGEKLVA